MTHHAINQRRKWWNRSVLRDIFNLYLSCYDSLVMLNSAASLHRLSTGNRSAIFGLQFIKLTVCVYVSHSRASTPQWKERTQRNTNIYPVLLNLKGQLLNFPRTSMCHLSFTGGATSKNTKGQDFTCSHLLRYIDMHTKRHNIHQRSPMGWWFCIAALVGHIQSVVGISMSPNWSEAPKDSFLKENHRLSRTTVSLICFYFEVPSSMVTKRQPRLFHIKKNNFHTLFKPPPRILPSQKHSYSAPCRHPDKNTQT